MTREITPKELCRLDYITRKKYLELYGECHADDCSEPKWKGNRFLCKYHYLHEDDAEYITKGDPEWRDVSISDIVSSSYTPNVLHFNDFACSQDQLSGYLDRGVMEYHF